MTDDPKYFKRNGWDINAHTSFGECWVTQRDPSGAKFVARFKYANPTASAKHFIKFLTEHMTPAEYFAARESDGAPGEILEKHGYIPYNVLRIAKRHGREQLRGTRYYDRLAA